MALASVARDTSHLRSSMTRGAVLLAAAVGLAVLHLPGRPRTVCLLRAVTGIPCPLCGGTTAAVQVGRGDLLGALRASPLAVLGAATFVAAPVARLPQLSSRSLWLLILTVAAAAELYQLGRFGLL
ncbi:MAG: hypothetical protein JWO27_2905 [Frankiales bacterium]|jgi:hypothetical protein|nr:hypothetical protein [Frankiales bacterium]